jgi:hypothetical protein
LKSSEVMRSRLIRNKIEPQIYGMNADEEASSSYPRVHPDHV